MKIFENCPCGKSNLKLEIYESEISIDSLDGKVLKCNCGQEVSISIDTNTEEVGGWLK